MELEPQAAVAKRERAPTPMDEEVRAKTTLLPIKEQRRSFQFHCVANRHRPPPIAPLRRLLSSPATWAVVFSFVGKKSLPDPTHRWSASAPTAGPSDQRLQRHL